MRGIKSGLGYHYFKILRDENIMAHKNRKKSKSKTKLHPRSKHRARYDFKILAEKTPELTAFVHVNKYEDESIDFFEPEAVKMLNKALIQHYYEVNDWDIPAGYLCPPIPGRADYIHYVADLLGKTASKDSQMNIPKGEAIKCLDVGVGANDVYPIIGASEYGWNFVGSDVDAKAIENVAQILSANPVLEERIELRQQINTSLIFRGIIQEGEHFDVTLCNPPFHSSPREAEEAILKKLRNLKGEEVTEATLNFGGQSKELRYKGGEVGFVRKLILESKEFSKSCLWFTTLISKQTNLPRVYSLLEEAKALEIKTIPMGQGNKVSRIVAWTFLTSEQKEEWVNTRWQK